MSRVIFALLATACVIDEPMVTVGLVVWEEDRECFGVLHKELPERYWAGWDIDDPYSSCGLDHERRRYPTYATTDGLCLRFTNPLEPPGAFDGCVVDDPWIRPCEEVPGCCDAGSKGDYPGCFPSDYEP